MADYRTPEEREAMRNRLYQDLQKKMKKRDAISPDADAEMDNARENYDQGNLISALFSGAAKMGSLGGKTSEGGIYDKFNKANYASAQDSYDSSRKMRQDQDTSINNDLHFGSALSSLDDQDFRRNKLNEGLLAKAESKKPSYQRTNYVDSNNLPLGFNPKTNEFVQAKIPSGSKLQRRPPSGMSDSNTNLAKSFETDYAKKAQISQVIDREVAIFDQKVNAGDVEGAVRHGEGMLKALNSAFGADAVGTEEAKRLGGFLQRFKAPWTPGSMTNYDLDKFSQQVHDKSSALKSAGQDSLQRAKSFRSGGGEIEPDGKMVQVTNGEETLEIPEGDLQEALNDGYEAVK